MSSILSVSLLFITAISHQIFFLLLSLILFLIFPLHIYYTIVVVPQLLDILFSLMLLFYLHFRFGNSYGHFLKFSDFFSFNCLSINEPIKGILHFCYSVFLIYSIFFWLLEFVSLLTLLLILICCLFHRLFNHVLNSWSHNSIPLLISESSSGACSVS